MKNKTSFLFFVFLFLMSCSHQNPPQETSALQVDTLTNNTVTEKPAVRKPIPLDTNSSSIWIYDYNTSIPVKNKAVDPDTLTPQKLMRFLDSDKIHLQFVKTSHDTIFVRIKESTYLTQQMGTTGADIYMSTTTFTLTELKGIKYVNFDFEEGDHASPGTYSREYYLERNKEHS